MIGVNPLGNRKTHKKVQTIGGNVSHRIIDNLKKKKYKKSFKF